MQQIDPYWQGWEDGYRDQSHAAPMHPDTLAKKPGLYREGYHHGRIAAERDDHGLA